jgi:hypothetical protein
MGEFPGSSDKFVDRSRVFQNQNSHSAIVCHGTGGSPTQTADQLGDYFESTPLVTSVHYGIDRAGAIDQYVLEADGAGGNCCLEAGHDPFWDQFGGDNLNVHTLSFETENDSANSLPLTDVQKETTFQLINYWIHKYGIPLENIKSHASLDPLSRAACPGPNFPWDELFTYLNGGAIMAIPPGWSDDGTVLTAPNGIPVTQGFRQYIIDNGWDKNNFPITAEYHADPLEHSNPKLGAGQRQEFRMGPLEYTPKKGVFPGWGGQELHWYQMQPSKISPTVRADVAALQTDATKLNTDLT